jgi:hypothetical protein
MRAAYVRDPTSYFLAELSNRKQNETYEKKIKREVIPHPWEQPQQIAFRCNGFCCQAFGKVAAKQ